MRASFSFACAVAAVLSLGISTFASGTAHAQSSGIGLVCDLEGECFASLPTGTASTEWTQFGTPPIHLLCDNQTECDVGPGCPPRVSIKRIQVTAFDANHNVLGTASAPVSCQDGPPL